MLESTEIILKLHPSPSTTGRCPNPLLHPSNYGQISRISINDSLIQTALRLIVLLLWSGPAPFKKWFHRRALEGIDEATRTACARIEFDRTMSRWETTSLAHTALLDLVDVTGVASDDADDGCLNSMLLSQIAGVCTSGAF